MEYTDFLRFLVGLTIEYIERVRNVSGVEFHMRSDEKTGEIIAKFDYGREARGDMNEAVCGAIAHSLRAIDLDT